MFMVNIVEDNVESEDNVKVVVYKTCGTCLSCGVVGVELVDGFLCEACFVDHARADL